MDSETGVAPLPRYTYQSLGYCGLITLPDYYPVLSYFLQNGRFPANGRPPFRKLNSVTNPSKPGVLEYKNFARWCRAGTERVGSDYDEHTKVSLDVSVRQVFPHAYFSNVR